MKRNYEENNVFVQTRTCVTSYTVRNAFTLCALPADFVPLLHQKF